MFRSKLTTAILMIALGLCPAARAQVTVDVAKITCDQYTSFKITDPQNVAIWLSGFYNAKRDNTIVDTQSLKENAKKVWDYCIRNLMRRAGRVLVTPVRLELQHKGLELTG